MSRRPLRIVFLGLSLSSSWGNGHATTFRALIAGLHQLGHDVTFLERETPWYAENRDLPEPSFCRLVFYATLDELRARHSLLLQEADAVVVGSYVPEGPEVLALVQCLASGTVAFYDIDTPITLAKLRRHDEEYVKRNQLPILDLYFSFAGGPTLSRLEQEFGVKRAVPLYCSVEHERYRPTGEPLEWDLGYLGTYSLDRQPALERLLLEPARRLPQMRFVVAGPQYPADISWPTNVQRIDHLPPEKHASFYSRQRFTLNITRADMVSAGWSPSVRLFEAGACGTPIVSDPWPGLTELLPAGEAVILAQSSDDIVCLLEQFPASRRNALASTARSIVLARHTGLARAIQFVAALRSSVSSPPSSRNSAALSAIERQ